VGSEYSNRPNHWVVMLIGHDSITYTVQGSTGLSPECYSITGGTECETVTQVNVNPSQLTITSVKGGAKHGTTI